MLLILGLSISACTSQKDVIKTNDNSTESPYPIVTYDISNVPAERIVEECNNAHNIFPKIGKTFDGLKDDVHSKLKKQYTSATLEKMGMSEMTAMFLFLDDSAYDGQDYRLAENAIEKIEYTGLQEQMNGSFDYYAVQGYNDGDRYNLGTEITLNVTDYNKAEKIFDLLTKELSTMYNNVQTSKQSVYWTSSGNAKNQNSIHHFSAPFEDAGDYFVTMKKVENEPVHQVVYQIWCRYIYEVN